MRVQPIRTKDIARKRILCIFPHPDDETISSAGIIYDAVRHGANVRVVCLTKGEQGYGYVPTGPRSIGEIRTEEFQNAMRVLGVTNYSIGAYVEATLERRIKEVRATIENELKTFKPHIVISYERFGYSDNPEHTVIPRILLDLQSRNIPRRYGVSKIYFSTLTVKTTKLLFHKPNSQITPPRYIYKMSLRALLKKSSAIGVYKSQVPGILRGILSWIPKLIYSQLGKEFYA